MYIIMLIFRRNSGPICIPYIDYNAAAIKCGVNDPNCRQLPGQEGHSGDGNSRICIDNHIIMLQPHIYKDPGLTDDDILDFPNSGC